MKNPHPSAALVQAVESQLHDQPVSWKKVSRGFTAADRWLVELKSGESVFVKVAVDQQTSNWIRSELVFYTSLRAPFMPKYIGSGTAEDRPFFILEDLRDAHWPPPWRNKQIHLLFDTLPVLHATPPPTSLPSLESQRPNLGGWAKVQENPEPFLSLQLCSPEWLEKALPQFVQTEASAVLTGHDLVHMDIRGDNVCFRGDQTIIVDWNFASCGNGAFDLIGWLPSLYLEGGPAPWEVTVDEPGLIALMGGYFASRSPLPPPRPDSTIREFQLQQLLVTLPWICKALQLPIPDELAARKPKIWS